MTITNPTTPQEAPGNEQNAFFLLKTHLVKISAHLVRNSKSFDAKLFPHSSKKVAILEVTSSKAYIPPV